jgi:hypothetical protein
MPYEPGLEACTPEPSLINEAPSRSALGCSLARVALWVLIELLLAAWRAEVIGLALIFRRLSKSRSLHASDAKVGVSSMVVYPRICSTDVNHVICNVEGVDLPGEAEMIRTGSHHSHGEGVRRRGLADDLIRLGEEGRRNREA